VAVVATGGEARGEESGSAGKEPPASLGGERSGEGQFL
jgi:hypothetical protein